MNEGISASHFPTIGEIPQQQMQVQFRDNVQMRIGFFLIKGKSEVIIFLSFLTNTN